MYLEVEFIKKQVIEVHANNQLKQQKIWEWHKNPEVKFTRLMLEQD